MNSRGKHLIDAVDPEESGQESTSQQQISDVAEPASTQQGADVDSAYDEKMGRRAKPWAKPRLRHRLRIM